ncbi:LysR family transcriptional regulator [Rhodovarius lipocyclicus]|uniref:LysR family transcriptional regulator n=1 Tax=Rhodovarius lipocyclicus TaxID=268410 RepID=UPI00135837F0|nr:LysR family transcriptional regulator [Rhodovarius lipocyclicus]
MSEPGTPTLDQLRVFLAVVEEGGFAAAARRQGRATSAITYAIDNLEAQLGLPLFDRVSTRRPALTLAGQAVLAEARAIAHDVDMLRARVKGLTQGLEAEVSLVVTVIMPMERLVEALRGFQAAFPTVPLRLHMEALGAVPQLVLNGTASLGVAGPIHMQPPGLSSIAAGHVHMIPVAAPGHPLAQGPNAPGAAAAYTQLVLTDRSPLTEGQDFAVLAPRTWRLADLGAKHALLRAGLGWGGMPEPAVREDLEAGRLVRLRLPDWEAIPYSFHIIHRTDTPPGPAARWLIRYFSAGGNEGVAPP